jgi:glutamine amidotransferase
MCRMVGVVFRGLFPVQTLDDLRSVARDGKVPGEDEPGHRDGWGVVSYSNGWPRYIGRSARSLPDDPSFESAVQDIMGLSPPNVLIAHARAASKGKATIQNAHPFVVGKTVLAHNGTVQGLEPPPGREPKGESDSEVLALILAERLGQERDLASALASVIREDIAEHDFSAAVLLASDGEKLLAYRDFKDPDRASYYDLRMARLGDSVVLFQETRCGYEGEAPPVAKGELVSIDLALKVDRRRLL